MNLDLKNKNALVCGSTQGIGWAIAQEIAMLGANVFLMARNADKLKENCNFLDTSKGQQHGFVVADFSKTESVKTAIEHFTKEKNISILVNNTGGPPAGLIENAKPEDFLSALNLHLINNHILVTGVLPFMKAEHFGRIINVISTSVKIPLNNLGVSNTTRAAVASWAKTLANEVAQFGITVNNVLPGATSTVRLASIIENKATKMNKEHDAISQEMMHEIPMKRFGEAEEIAAMAAFLASPAASYITGQSICVDGGRTGSI